MNIPFFLIWITIVIVYSALTPVVSRRWGLKALGLFFVAVLVTITVLVSLWYPPETSDPVSYTIIVLIMFGFPLFLASSPAFLFHLFEDSETERKYALLNGGLAAFFGVSGLIPALFSFWVLSCLLLNQCV